MHILVSVIYYCKDFSRYVSLMVLRSADTEMNISQFGAKERKTRIGYKDKQKRDAFMQMQHIGMLNLFSLP